MKNKKRKKIWIDLDNSPHVPFFKPIIAELADRQYSMVVTARDCFQVCGLADLLHVPYKRIGKHYGKHKIMKILGSLLRTLQLMPTVLRERPALALSHGSRTQQLLSAILRIPNVMIYDYEHATAIGLLHPTYVVVPDVIADKNIRFHKSQVRKYPGIKEDVYVPDFRPDPEMRRRLGIGDDEIIVTIRPPATEAHYRSPESERLFVATIEHLAGQSNVRIVMLPRNERQADHIRNRWPDLVSAHRIVIPSEVLDGLNLIWCSDLVISGGGTMNREAAALGVPVYSIFRGTTGAVDQYLEKQGRLTLIKTEEDVRSKIRIQRRDLQHQAIHHDRSAMKHIVSAIEEAINRECPEPEFDRQVLDGRTRSENE